MLYTYKLLFVQCNFVLCRFLWVHCNGVLYRLQKCNCVMYRLLCVQCNCVMYNLLCVQYNLHCTLTSFCVYSVTLYCAVFFECIVMVYCTDCKSRLLCQECNCVMYRLLHVLQYNWVMYRLPRVQHITV